MFENLYIRENLVKPYLEAICADPRGQRPLPVASTCPIVQDWHKMFMEVMRDHGYEDGPIFYKGAKMCLMWPVWHTAFPKAKDTLFSIYMFLLSSIHHQQLSPPFDNLHTTPPSDQEIV